MTIRCTFKIAAVALATSALFVLSVGAQNAQPADSAANSTSSMPHKADADMQKVLDALASLKPKPIETLDASEARSQPGPADAVKKVMKDENNKADPHQGLSVSNSHFADMGNLRLRYYMPENAKKDANLPTIVYFRGGGWVIADLDAYDASAAALARKTQALVVSVDYPMAPEHKFPAAHDEAFEAYRYIAKNAKGWGGNPDKMALVGESAGGNLAVATAIKVRDSDLPKPLAVVAVYPVATTSADTPSKKEEANAKPLNTAMMGWFFDKVVDDKSKLSDKRLDLVNADLKNLPPVTIINAEIDPLRSDGDMLTSSLKAAGNQTTHQLYPGVTHEFFGMDAVVAKAKEAQDFAVAQLKKGFGNMRATENTPDTMKR